MGRIDRAQDGNMVERVLSQPCSGVGRPPDPSLPYFAYGLLRPGELAYPQVEAMVANATTARLKGDVLVRDGLPLLDIEGRESVDGVILAFADPTAAYAAIAAFEPSKHYRWDTRSTIEGARVNVLVGRSPGKGSQRVDDEPWSSLRDPVLLEGTQEVLRVVERDATDSFGNALIGSNEWRRYFRIQMGYLMLWSIIERFSALSVGPALDPMERVNRLSETADVQKAVREVVRRTDQLFDSRDPNNNYKLTPERPGRALHYFHALRSNMVHRGKGAWAEGERVRKALIDLAEIVRRVLVRRGVRIGDGQ